MSAALTYYHFSSCMLTSVYLQCIFSCHTMLRPYNMFTSPYCTTNIVENLFTEATTIVIGNILVDYRYYVDAKHVLLNK